MAEVTGQRRAAEIGPSITYHTKEQQMAKLAGKTEWVDTGDGVRRLVVEGAPIPPGLSLEDQQSGDDVEARTLSRPVVDEEASKSMYERTGATPPDPRAGLSTENAEQATQGGSRRGRRATGAGGGGGSDS